MFSNPTSAPGFAGETAPPAAGAAKPVTVRKLLNAREREFHAEMAHLRAKLALATHYAELQLHSNRLSRNLKSTLSAIKAMTPGCGRQVGAVCDEGVAVSGMRMQVNGLYRDLDLTRTAARKARRAMDRLENKAAVLVLAEFRLKSGALARPRFEERLDLNQQIERQERLLEERRESGEEPADPDADRDHADEHQDPRA